MNAKNVCYRFAGCALVVSLCAFGQNTLATQDAVTDIPALVRQSAQKSSENWRARGQHYSDFTYKIRWVERRQGKPEESQVFEMYFPDAKREYKRYRSVQIMLERNGRPLPPERIEAERRKAGEQLAKEESNGTERSEDAAAQASAPWMITTVNVGGGKKATVNVAEVMETCEFHSPRRARLNDRETIVLDFRPRSGARFSAATSYMPRVAGRLWIDAQDQVVVRCAIWPQALKTEAGNEAAFTYELVKVKEGLWLAGRLHINSTKYPDLFPALKNIEVISEQFDYQYFGVGLEKERLKAPGQ